MKKTPVTQSYLPSLSAYTSYLERIWESHHLTNNGPLLTELEQALKVFLGTPYFHFVTNGTLALQIAMRALDLTEGEVITTPFSYVATTSSILWERCVPVFVDIDPDTFCLDPQKIEAAITPRTRAIMAVHVFGYPCAVEEIEAIAQRHSLKVIYDGAHAFACRYKGRSLLSYGDIATCSFHATKVFHTIEGGCVISQSEDIHKRLSLLRSFGHVGDDHFELGINAKGSEFQAAMGLCNLSDFQSIVTDRKVVAEVYDSVLPLDWLQRPKCPEAFEYNYSYYPVVFPTEDLCLAAIAVLNAQQIFPRRYFFPSLNTLPYLETTQSCPVSESLSRRIICLPFYPGLDDEVVHRTARLIAGVR